MGYWMMGDAAGASSRDRNAGYASSARGPGVILEVRDDEHPSGGHLILKYKYLGCCYWRGWRVPPPFAIIIIIIIIVTAIIIIITIIISPSSLVSFMCAARAIWCSFICYFGKSPRDAVYEATTRSDTERIGYLLMPSLL